MSQKLDDLRDKISQLEVTKETLPLANIVHQLIEEVQRIDSVQRARVNQQVAQWEAGVNANPPKRVV